MATYKKKPKNKKETSIQNSAINQESTTENVFNTLDESASISENWIEQHYQKLLYSLSIIVIGIFGYLFYQRFVMIPAEKEAMNELFYPKQTFAKLKTATTTEKDSIYRLGLEGINGKYGFVDIADLYGNTKGGNLAKYYAGLSYIGLKNYEEGIKWLQDFDSDDLFLQDVKNGAIGDAFANLNELEKAISYYEKAIESDNIATTPLFLFKAGNMAFALKDYKKSEKFFKQIKKHYPESVFANQIDLHINKAAYAQY